MIRFSAGDDEIGALFRFLRKRAPDHKLFLAPLRPDRPDRRIRRTERPLLAALAADAAATRWGIYTTLDHVEDAVRADDDACLMILQLSAADASGRREALLEARDEMTSDRRAYTRRAQIARSLVEKCARRLRRRGHREKGRWIVG